MVAVAAILFAVPSFQLMAVADTAVAQTLPERAYSFIWLSVDPANGRVAVLKYEHDKNEVAIYEANGKLRVRFRTPAGANFLTWLPGSRLLVTVSFPERGEASYLFDADGNQIGRFGGKSVLLQMFVRDGKWISTDETPGGILVGSNGAVYETARNADEDFAGPGEIEKDPAKRTDKGLGARVVVFDQSGNYVRTIGEGWGTAPGQMRRPQFLALSADEKIIAVDNDNGIDEFDVATGDPIRRLAGWRIADESTGPVLTVLKNNQLQLIDFEGNPAGAIAVTDPPLTGGFRCADGTLYLLGGPGNTFFRQYDSHGKLIVANGEPFTALAVSSNSDAVAAGGSFPFRGGMIDSARYYAGEATTMPLYAFGRPLAGGPWRLLAINSSETTRSVAAPADLNGPIEIRFASQNTPDSPLTADFKLHAPGVGPGTVTVFTPRNRETYQQGESVLFHVVVRSRAAASGWLTVALWDHRRCVATGKAAYDVPVGGSATTNMTLPASLTAALLPGRYMLTAAAGQYKDYPADIDIVSSLPLTDTHRCLVWDSDFTDWAWSAYPLERNELTAWAGMDTMVKYLQYGQPLLARADPGDADYFRDDPALPAADKAFRPDEWAAAMDHGLRNGIGVMPLIQTGWESYPVMRDAPTLARDSQLIEEMAQSLGNYPNFRGLDFSVTNFFMYPFEKEYNAATGEDAPTRERVQASLNGGKWDSTLASQMDRYLKWLTGIYVNDYTAWSSALHAVKPAAPRMATIIAAELADWAPEVGSVLDTTQAYMQSEQIQPPYEILANGSWATLPGKANASTFEGFNEIGTGERTNAEIGYSLLLGAQPGVVSPYFTDPPTDVRGINTRRGELTVYREFFRRYQLVEDLLTADRLDCSIAILVDRNQALAEFRLGHQWSGQSTLWLRHYSASILCRMAQRPARTLYSDDLAAGRGLNGVRAILLAGQTAPLAASELGALSKFEQHGGIVMGDADTTAVVGGMLRLPVSAFALQDFGFYSKHGPFQTDGSWEMVPAMLHAALPGFRAALDKCLGSNSGAYADDPDVFVAHYQSGACRYLGVVDTKRLPIPGLEYAKINARFATVMPLIAHIHVPAGTSRVYDIMAGRDLPVVAGAVLVDLRCYACTALALLPSRHIGLTIGAPGWATAGHAIVVRLGSIVSGEAHGSQSSVTGTRFGGGLPYAFEARTSDGRLLARRFGATDDAGIAVIALTAPLETSRLLISAVCTASGEASTAAIGIRTPGAAESIDESYLRFRTDQIAAAIRAGVSVVLLGDGDRATMDDVRADLDAAKTPYTVAKSYDEVKHAPGQRQLLFITGGSLLDDCAPLLPFCPSSNVPGHGNRALAYVFAPREYLQDAVVVLADDISSRRDVSFGLRMALGLPIGGNGISFTQRAAPPPPSLPPPAQPQGTAIERFRAELADGDASQPLPGWIAAIRRPATARLGSVAVSPDGATVTVGASNWDANIYSVSAASGRLRWAAHAGQGYVRSVWALGGGDSAAYTLTTDDDSHQIELFGADGSPVKRFAAPGAAAIPDGRYLDFSAEPHGSSFAITADGSTLVASGNFAVAAWDVRTGRLLWRKDYFDGIAGVAEMPAARLAVAPGGSQVAVFYCHDEMYDAIRYQPVLEVRDTRTGAVQWSYTPDPFDHVEAYTPTWSPDGKRVLIGNINAAWEVEDGKVMRTFQSWPGDYRPGSYELFDGKTLLGEDGSVRWSANSAGQVTGVAWAATGSVVVVGTDLGELCAYDADGALKWSLTRPAATAVACDGAGNVFAADWDGGLSRISVDNGKVAWSTNLANARLSAAPLLDSAWSAPPAAPLVEYWPEPQDDGVPSGENLTAGASIQLAGQGGWGFHGTVVVDPKLLINGQTDDLSRSWQDIDEQWTALTFGVAPQAAITLQGSATVTGFVVHESSAHPEAFIRFALVEAMVDGQWKRIWSGPVSHTLTHSITLPTPVRTTAIRYTPLMTTLNGVYTSEIEVIGRR